MNELKAQENGKKLEHDSSKDHDSDCSYDSGSCSSNFSSESEDEEITDLTAKECAKVKQAYLQQMSELEKRILAVQEMIFKEKMVILERELVEAKNSNSKDYLKRLSQLDENRTMKLQVADASLKFKFESITRQNDAEILSSQQEYLEDAINIFERLKNDIEGSIIDLEEENCDDNLSNNNLDREMKKNHKSYRDIFELNYHKKRPVTVSGPIVVYRLKDSDILQDWKIIKNAIAEKRRRRKKYIFRRRFKHEFQLKVSYEPTLPDFLRRVPSPIYLE